MQGFNNLNRITYEGVSKKQSVSIVNDINLLCK